MSDDVPFKGQYQEWSRVQFQAAHHDIWWTKGHQLKVANATLLLLGTVVAASKLLWSSRSEIPTIGLFMLSLLGFVVITLGSWHAWDLYYTLLKARTRAQNIANVVDDPKNLLAGAKEPVDRNIEFPLMITGIHVIAWSVTLAYFWG